MKAVRGPYQHSLSAHVRRGRPYADDDPDILRYRLERDRLEGRSLPVLNDAKRMYDRQLEMDHALKRRGRPRTAQMPPRAV